MTRAPALPPPGRKRKHRSKTVDLHACLYALKIDPTQPWEMQHSPPLALRPWNDETGDYDPPENDPRYMYPMQKAEHAKVTSEVDRPAIDKTRRVAKRQAIHVDKMKPFLEGGDKCWDVLKAKPTKWPRGRKLQSRGFQSRPRKRKR